MDYKEKLRLAKEALDSGSYDRETIEYIFPELKESEDENIRKAILELVKQSSDILNPMNQKSMIDWLEKQGKRKPTDKVEPKFKVGDWVVYNRNDSSREIIQVYDIRDGRYYFTDNVHFSWSIKECDEKAHLWTIQDAKDGDVLDFDCGIGIFKNLLNRYNAHCYCYYDTNNQLETVDSDLYDVYEAKPATKGQRDLLFKKMKEAGYEWDAEKKELKKIEHESADKSDVLMSIDEAIAHCKEKSRGDNACALEHKQLEKWLTELKKLREERL